MQFNNFYDFHNLFRDIFLQHKFSSSYCLTLFMLLLLSLFKRSSTTRRSRKYLFFFFSFLFACFLMLLPRLELLEFLSMMCLHIACFPARYFFGSVILLAKLAGSFVVCFILSLSSTRSQHSLFTCSLPT